MIKFVVFLLALSFVSAGLPTVRLNWDRIIGGENANEGEFPYMVSLRKPGTKPPGHICGASILTDTWILTAAHCCNIIDVPKNFVAYAGSIYLNKGGSNHTIVRVVPHQEYGNGSNHKDDICVIQVSTPFKFSNNVAQITIASKDVVVKTGDKVTTSGWGFTRPDASGQKDLPNRLQKGVDFKALDHDDCYGETGYTVHEEQVCVEGREIAQTTWVGDSGSPLIRNGAQVGVYSYKFLPYYYHLPSVFTYTVHYVDWIKKQLGPDASKLKIK